MRLRPVCTLSGHTELRVWHVAWEPHGTTLASCGEDRTIRLWTAVDATEKQWQCTAILEDGHQRTIRWCSWSPDARFVASCSFDGTASVWECLDGEFDCVASLEGHENEVKAVEWSSSGDLLATCGRDKSVFIWERDDETYEVAAVLHSHSADVKAVRWHPATDVLASASYDDTLKLYSMADGDWRCVSTLSAHKSTVWALAFSQDGKGLVSCSDDRAIALWIDATGTCDYVHAATLADAHERSIYAIDWASDACGGLIATAGADDAVSIVRATLTNTNGGADHSEMAASPGLALIGKHSSAHTGDVNSVAWRPTPKEAVGSPRAGWVASCGDDGCVRMWCTEPVPNVTDP